MDYSFLKNYKILKYNFLIQKKVFGGNIWNSKEKLKLRIMTPLRVWRHHTNVASPNRKSTCGKYTTHWFPA